MRKTNRVYLVTWSYPGGGWCTVRAYVDTKAQARTAAKNQYGPHIEVHAILDAFKCHHTAYSYQISSFICRLTHSSVHIKVILIVQIFTVI